MKQFLNILIFLVLTVFSAQQIGANSAFVLTENSYSSVKDINNAGGDVFKHIDLVKAEQRYARSYERSGQYGFDLSLDNILRKYGEKGKKLVLDVEKEVDEILSKLPPSQNKVKGDPVLSGIIDTKRGSGEIFFGRNLKNKAEVDEFIKNAHPFIRERYLLHVNKLEKGLVKAPIDDIKRAGTTYNGETFESFLVHSEVVALDKAIKARGGVFKEADLQDFLLHNRQLFKGKKGVPPRCVNCWHQTDGLKVIGND